MPNMCVNNPEDDRTNVCRFIAGDWAGLHQLLTAEGTEK